MRMLLILFLLIPLAGRSQKWVADSLTIGFGETAKMEHLSFSIENATDTRNQFPEFISVFERKKWLFFPVDQIVKTKQPLSEHFIQRFQSDSTASLSYKVNIKQFYINQQVELGKRKYHLFSTLEWYSSGVDSIPVGTFYYERSFQQKKKLPVGNGYEKLIDEWSKKMTGDVLLVEKEIDQFLPDQLYHFRRGKTAVNRNFYTSVELFAGLDFWGIDGQLWFSEPEGNRIFNRATGIIRYVNHPAFQAIAVGRNVRLWNYRVTNHWLFTHKLAFLIGFNNWKDMKTVRHKLEEVPLFNLSFTQQINFNGFDQTGFVFGLGLMEDLHYIIYHQPELKIGLALNCAYKF